MTDVAPLNEQTPLFGSQRVPQLGRGSEERPETDEIAFTISRTTALSLGLFLSVLFTSFLPGLSRAYLPFPPYDKHPWELNILLSCWYVVGPIAALLCAANVNKYGIRKLFALALSTLTVGSTVIIIAPTWPIFVFARILQSIACGPVMSLATAALVKIHGAERKGSIISYFLVTNIAGLVYSNMVGKSYSNWAPWHFHAILFAALAGVLRFWLHKWFPQDRAATDDDDQTHTLPVGFPSVNIFLAFWEIIQRPKVLAIGLVGSAPLLYLPSLLVIYFNNENSHDWTDVGVLFCSGGLYFIGALVGAGFGGRSSDNAIKSRMPHSIPADRLRVFSTTTLLFIPLTFVGLFALYLIPFNPSSREEIIAWPTTGLSPFLGFVAGKVLTVATVYVAESGSDDAQTVGLVVANEFARLILPSLVIGTVVLFTDREITRSKAVDLVVISIVSVISVLLLSALRWIAPGASRSESTATPDQASDGTLSATGGGYRDDGSGSAA
ncbi:MFS general substrate transporter [Coprinopsis marcescibilis]|uniref:MFS general substrate transporter n=1 Tax=Coprinopsis marcescibilis TaxID=230819 RepID=A0A5C3KNH6_COPMA|nr:MFS general substrate transporter [Coprinopsis marcescibilis]